MAEIDPNEAPLFDVDEIAEGDVEGDDSRGGLTLEGVEIPFDILEHGNGRLPDSALERIGIGGHRLHRAAAAAFGQFRQAAQGAGIDLTLTDSYRDYDEQVDLKRRKPSLSATPGKSVHGWGFAVDVAVGTPPKGFGQTVYAGSRPTVPDSAGTSGGRRTSRGTGCTAAPVGEAHGGEGRIRDGGARRRREWRSGAPAPAVPADHR